MEAHIFSEKGKYQLQKAFGQQCRVFVLIVAMTVFGSVAYGQMYHYEFSISGITDGASAKEITDIIRQKFNTEEEPFSYFPEFDDDADEFNFESSVLVEEQAFENYLVNNGLELVNWQLSVEEEGD